MPPKQVIPSPKGTRDFYPEDQLRRRYITETWRAVSLRHGFEEIDGPTFELTELYAVKSGEGILNELFQAFSGKSAKELERVRTEGRAPYALRPEFTPTLARMYAARAAQLPRPVRWFCTPTFYRAERPQRGRLREFGQWNCDVIGDESDNAVLDVLEVIGSMLGSLGAPPDLAEIRVSDRRIVSNWLEARGISGESQSEAFAFFDAIPKMSEKAIHERARQIGLSIDDFDHFRRGIRLDLDAFGTVRPDTRGVYGASRNQPFWRLIEEASNRAIRPIPRFDPFIVRGLAYYTGTVFEVLAEGERAVAGGGRYDNLIELFGGPPTPAVGFGMGDVVLANLLADKGLMPEPAELPEAVDAVVRSQRIRPEVFLAPGSSDEDALIPPLIGALRRGVENEVPAGDAAPRPWSPDRWAVRPIHARTTDKATRNPKKLLQDANRQRARLYAQVHAPDKIELRDLDTGDDVAPPAGEHSFNSDPAHPAYLGKAVAAHLP